MLLAIASYTAEGVLNGWLTLTHERARLQAQPANSLRDAWPQLLRPQCTIGLRGVPRARSGECGKARAQDKGSYASEGH